MKSAITNIGRQFIVNNTTGGAWFSITHFALAWVNDAERLENPPTEECIALVKPQVGGNNNGDYIFNIWQTAFTWDATGRKFGLGEDLPQGFGAYYRYDYDSCGERNKLSVYASGMEGLPTGAKVSGSEYYGASNGYSGNSSGSASQLNLENIPAPLAYNLTTAVQFGTKTYSKLFPIKAFRAIETTDDTINAKVSLMDYVLELPAVTAHSSDPSYSIENSIGNFKFNRIGLYATKSTSPDPIPDLITSLTPVADEEPVLFAIIDLSSDDICGDSILDIFKTRDDSGLSSFTYDAQIPLSSVNEYPNFPSAVSLYRDSARDDATNHYLNQLEATANTVEAIMQLQMQVIQLSQYIEKLTGNNPLKANKSGFGSILKLQPNMEYFIDDGDKDITYFKGDYFRSLNDTNINNSNAVINIKSKLSSGGIEDGRVIKIIVDNMDGRSYTTDALKHPLWGGKIYITNYDGSVKSMLLEVDSATLRDYGNAKISIELSYSQANSCWIVIGLHVIDETSIIG